MTSTGGEFTLTGSTASGVSILRSSGAEIAKINESTGVITIIGIGVTSRVRPAGEKIPLQIQLVESNGSVLYSQSFALPKSTRIVDTPTNTSGASEPTLQVTLSSGYTLVRNASNTPTLPSGAYITSIDRKAIGALGTDGNIYLLSEKYTLSYRSEGGKVVIDIRDSSGIVASVMYSIASEYVTK